MYVHSDCSVLFCNVLILEWSWNGPGVVLFWSWKFSGNAPGMVLEWAWNECMVLYCYVLFCMYYSGPGMVLEWPWNGPVMVLEWSWNGPGIVLECTVL